MITGYTKPLYILPFDHRVSYVSRLFGWEKPLNVEQMAAVAHSKQIIYKGFQLATADHVLKDCAGILVDEEFGSAILRDGTHNGYITAVPVEKGGQSEFDFIYGDDFAQHVEAFHPTFAKALVRYNPEGDSTFNRRQASYLKRLSNHLERTQTLFMCEVLVPPEPKHLEQLKGDMHAYDQLLRPSLMIQAIQELQNSDVEPDVWKVEGFDHKEVGDKLVEVAQRDGRSNVGLIVLGRGEERERVEYWLKTAASVSGFIGFAVGRTSFWSSIADFEAKRISEDEAIAQIAHNFEEWINIFEKARSS